MFLAMTNIIINILINTLGSLANGYAIYYIFKTFDLKKTVFKLILLDSFVSMILCSILLFTNIFIPFIPRNDPSCAMLILGPNFNTFNGLVVAFLIGIIR